MPETLDSSSGLKASLTDRSDVNVAVYERSGATLTSSHHASQWSNRFTSREDRWRRFGGGSELTLGTQQRGGGGGVFEERLNSRMTHAWYNGCLQSLTSKADKGRVWGGRGTHQLPVWCQLQLCPPCHSNSVVISWMELSFSDTRRSTLVPGGLWRALGVSGAYLEAHASI